MFILGILYHVGSRPSDGRELASASVLLAGRSRAPTSSSRSRRRGSDHQGPDSRQVCKQGNSGAGFEPALPPWRCA